MKTPVVLVTATLTVAILLAASFLIATGTRGENAFRLRSDETSSLDQARAPMMEPQRFRGYDGE
jgi:hypothetical protein